MTTFEIVLTQQAEKDIEKHKNAGDRRILRKILRIFEELTIHPYVGIGKPEPLKYEMSGRWSRRINLEHRIIYRVSDQAVYILSVFGHYE